MLKRPGRGMLNGWQSHAWPNAQMSMTERGRKDISLRELQIILMICEMKNLSKAAMRLGIAQPSLSRLVRTIEERFKIRFFDRHGRGVELTTAGIALRDHAFQMLGATQDFNARLDDLREELNGSVSLIILSHLSHALSPLLIRKFTSQYPKTIINVFEENQNTEIRQRIIAGEADFGLFLDSSENDYRNAEVVAREEVYLIGLPGTIDKEESGPIEFAELAGIPLLMPRKKTPYRDFLEDVAGQSGVQLNVIRELEMSSTLLAFVIEREGATILPKSHCHSMLKSGHIVARKIVNPRISRRVVLVRSAAKSNKAVKFALHALRETIAEASEGLQWEILS